MLQFNELKITPDNKKLIIDTQVEELPYFEGVTIDSVFIDTQDTWVINGPSENATRVYFKDGGEALDKINDSSKRHIRLEIENPMIDTSTNNMYFVYVIADISEAPSTLSAPCDINKDRIIGTVVNLYNFYNTLIAGIKELEQTCSIPKNLIDSYLKQQVIDTCIKVGNYPLAIKYWKKFFLNTKKQFITKPCMCNE